MIGFFRLIILLLPVICFSMTSAEQIQQAATDSANAVVNKVGSKDGIRNNVVLPMTSSNTAMATIDNSISFSAQMTCPSSHQFLEVFVQPAQSGDLTTVIVSQDTDFDGSADYTYQLPVTVSGICANGIISCNAGTWDNCRSYGWTADADYRTSLTQVTYTDLGGCYCINSSCGTNIVWDNIGLVLKNLGGGPAAALQSRNPQFTVTDVRVDGTLILYYGQKSGACTTGANGTGTLDPQRYYSNSTLMVSDTDSTRIAQTTDPDSYYNLLQNSSAFTSGELRTCRISRLVTYDEGARIRTNRDYTFIGGWDQNGGSKNCFYSTGWSSNCYQLAGDVGSWNTCWNTYLASSTRIASYITSLFLNNNPDEYIDTVNTVTKSAMSNLSGCYGSDNDSTDVRIYANVDVITLPACEELPYTEYIDDRCSTLESDAECSLSEERVDSVYTYRNSNPTGLTPLPSSKSFPLANCVRSYTADWWQKDRTYLCRAVPYDFSDAQRRVGNISRTTTDNVGSISYEDLRKTEDGTWVTDNISEALPARSTFESCAKACKTKKLVLDTQASGFTNVSQYRVNSQGYETYYKACVNDVCPASADETIDKNCQCLNNFSEAAAEMQSLRTAGRDMICSDNIAKPLR